MGKLYHATKRPTEKYGKPEIPVKKKEELINGD